MPDSMNCLREDGHALGITLIWYAAEHSEVVFSEQHLQTRFVREFLVMCHMAFGILAGTPPGKVLLAGMEAEFTRYNPAHLELLETRMASYFEVTKNVTAEDFPRNLANSLTLYVEETADIPSWASGVLMEAIALFVEAAMPELAVLQ